MAIRRREGRSRHERKGISGQLVGASHPTNYRYLPRQLSAIFKYKIYVYKRNMSWQYGLGSGHLAAKSGHVGGGEAFSRCSLAVTLILSHAGI